MTQEPDTLEILRAELDFIEKGGYGRSVKTPWQPTSIFKDSPICLNFADPEGTQPCSKCLLFDFVPTADLTRAVPCHHIPLNAKQETIGELQQNENQSDLEDNVKVWLRATIKRLEALRSPRLFTRIV